MSDVDEVGELARDDQLYLLRLARRTLSGLDCSGAAIPDEKILIVDPIPSAVRDPRGVFVSLHNGAMLRGCIGYVEPVVPLYRGVIENAVSAARRDTRFSPVTLEEVIELTIEISVMTLPRVVESVEEIEVGRHGLIVGRGFSRGLLLPQVATGQCWDRETFLDQTCRKAGLPRDAWRRGDVKIEVFSAQVFSDGH